MQSIVILSLLMSAVSGANILGIFTTTTKSHLIVHLATIQALVDRGHNVTIITVLPIEEKQNSGFHHIHTQPIEDDITEFRRLMSVAASTTSPAVSTQQIIMANVKRVEIQDKALRHDRFQELLNNTGNHFDLVILGLIFNSFQLGVAAHFKCPSIVSWVNLAPNSILSLVGNTLPESITFLKNSDGLPGFGERLGNFIQYLLLTAIEWFSEYKMEQYYSDHFSADRYPSYDAIKKNVSLLFSATHFSDGYVRPMVPAFIEIGGIQVKEEPDPLPEDIATFLKDADHGFILFSLGTSAQISDLPSNTTLAIFRVLSNVKQKVLWKLDGPYSPGRASNIMFRKWFPQTDILAHPKLRLFITHAGRGSTYEARFHAVPMLAMPMFGDQFMISKHIEAIGLGLVVNPHNLTEEVFAEKLHEILTNTSYSKTALKLASLYKDRPLSAKQSVVYWTEYVLRHRGAKHMQSPAVYLNFFQQNNLDIIGMLAVVLLGPVIIVVMFVWSVMRRKVKTD